MQGSKEDQNIIDQFLEEIELCDPKSPKLGELLSQYEDTLQVLESPNSYSDFLLVPAIRLGNFMVVKQLIEHAIAKGNKIGARSQHNLMKVAVSSSQTANGKRILAILMKTVDADMLFKKADHDNRSALHKAALMGVLEVFQMFQNKKLPQLSQDLLEHKDNYGHTVLHIAQSIEVLEALVSIQPELIDQRTNNGQTALHTFVINEKYEMAKFLLDTRPELVRVTDNLGQSVYWHLIEKLKKENDIENEIGREGRIGKLRKAAHSSSSDGSNFEILLKEKILRLNSVSVAEVRRTSVCQM